MLASEISVYLECYPQMDKFFSGIATIDNIPYLEEEDFAIINTEYVHDNVCKGRIYILGFNLYVPLK